MTHLLSPLLASVLVTACGRSTTVEEISAVDETPPTTVAPSSTVAPPAPTDPSVLAAERSAAAAAYGDAGVVRGRMPGPRFYADARWLQGSADGRGIDLVFHWELWCGPCREEMPRLLDLGRRHREEGLDVVGLTTLSRDTSETRVRAFLEREDILVPMAVIPPATRESQGVDSVPYALILRDGRVIWRGHPATLEEARLVALLR